MEVLPKSLKRTSELCNTVQTPGRKREPQNSCWGKMVEVGFLAFFFFLPPKDVEHNNLVSSI